MGDMTIVGTEKGGAGKSLVSLFLGGLAAEHGRHVQYVCLDSQRRIERCYPDQSVGTTRLAKASELAEDAFAQARHYSIWRTALENLADDTLLVVDVGAPQFRAAIEYAVQSHMADRLQQKGIAVTFVVPLLAETESRKAALRALQAAQLAFPGCKLALVRNERDGLFGGPLEPEAAAAEERIAREFPDIAQLRLPRVQRQAWQPIENASIAPLVARDLDRETIGNLLQCSGDIAAMASDMIAVWVEQTALSWRPQLPFLGEAPVAEA
jgi:hypothetical protein